MKNTQTHDSAAKSVKPAEPPRPARAARSGSGKASSAKVKVARLDDDPSVMSVARPAGGGKAKRSAHQGDGATGEADLQGMIREEAYFRAERRGFAAGFEWQDWFEAEQTVYRRFERTPPHH